MDNNERATLHINMPYYNINLTIVSYFHSTLIVSAVLIQLEKNSQQQGRLSMKFVGISSPKTLFQRNLGLILGQKRGQYILNKWNNDKNKVWYAYSMPRKSKTISCLCDHLMEFEIFDLRVVTSFTEGTTHTTLTNEIYYAPISVFLMLLSPLRGNINLISLIGDNE